MENRRYSEELIRDWCREHFPDVEQTSADIVLEGQLKDILVEGSTYFDRYPVPANRTLHNLKPKDRYTRYFLNRASVDSIGFENFHYLCNNGGGRYTNEYQYATVLRKLVDEEVFVRSVELLNKYEIYPD